MRIITLCYLFALGLLLGMAIPACSGLKGAGKTTATSVVDCSLVAIGEHAKEIEAAIRDATNMDGSIDWTKARDAVKRLGWDVGGCAMAAVIAKLLAPSTGARLAPSPDPDEVRSEWNLIRHEVLGGRSYRLASGQTL